MDVTWVIGAVVTGLVPIMLSVLVMIRQGQKDAREERREAMESSSKLAEAITSLRDEIRFMRSDNEKRDEKIDDHEKRIGKLEDTCIVLGNDMKHYHCKDE